MPGLEASSYKAKREQKERRKPPGPRRRRTQREDSLCGVWGPYQDAVTVGAGAGPRCGGPASRSGWRPCSQEGECKMQGEGGGEEGGAGHRGRGRRVEAGPAKEVPRTGKGLCRLTPAGNR